MTAAGVQGNNATATRRGVRSWVAAIAAGALIAGSLVTVGVGAQMALAAPIAPEVSASLNDAPLVAGEAGSLDVSFSNDAAATGTFNLSAMLVLPLGVAVTDTGALGAPTKTYTQADGALPGAYGSATDCAALGLASGPTAGKCQVPAGFQLFVFENISDLPARAANGASVTILPDIDVFEPGDEVPFIFTGFTSDNVNMLPVFPGSTSKATNANHTSAPGVSAGVAPVEALRIAKSEPSPEKELLRGVHQNQTVYTLRISHTGEGDVTNAKVVDYLPAGLEYLGSGQADNTMVANGNGAADSGATDEYSGSDTMASRTTQPTHWRAEESVVTVRGGFVDGAFVESADGAVFTKVTWDLATLLAEDGEAQNFAGEAPGTAGVLELQYVAGIPLFENSYIEGTFDEQADGTHGATGQAANLDNNTGPSTRHGDEPDAGTTSDISAWEANSLTNVATVSGDYALQHPANGATPAYSSSASGSYTVDAVDVRLLKTTDTSAFEQNELATYNLNISTSEYVSAQLADEPGPSASVRPNRLVDDMADGICPVFNDEVKVTAGASTHPGLPNLRIGDPNSPSASDQKNLTAEEWNAIVGADGTGCGYPSARAEATLTSASLTGISFDPATGHFFVDFWIMADGSGIEANGNVNVSYQALQNTIYSENEGSSGATSSGDRVKNSAEVVMTTFPTDATSGTQNVNGTGVGGEWRATDDSESELRAVTGGMKKYVLPRSAGAQTADSIVDAELNWEDEKAPEPFAAGDEVWYRINLTAPGTAEVRNPMLSDYLPAGVELPEGWPNADPAGGYTDYVVVPPTTLPDYGSCETEDASDWIDTYVGGGVPEVSATGTMLSWKLGSNQCVSDNTTDRFLPKNASLVVYVKATVTGTSAAATQDLPQNLAKYRQQGRLGSTEDIDIFFLRDAAEIELVSTPTLVKGIARNTFAGISGLAADGWMGTPASNGAQQAARDYAAGSNATGAAADNAFGSDVDGEYAVQDDAVTFRVDVTAPMGNAAGSVQTERYVIWDALPEGVTAADVRRSHETVTNTDSTPVEVALEEDSTDFQVLDPGKPGYPAAGQLNPAFAGRSLIVWNVNAAFPGSQSAGEDTAAVTSGFSLFYTVTVPSEPNSGNDRRDALLLQRYENTASIVQYDAVTQTGADGSATTIVPVGEGTLRNNGSVTDPTLPEGAKAAPADQTFDDSFFEVPNAAMKKTLVKTEVPSTSPAVTDAQNTAGVIVQGEYATYDVSVRIPAHTTVQHGELKDAGTLARVSGTMSPTTANYQLESATLVDENGAQIAVPSGFTLNAKGVLSFPDFYQTGADAETFTVRLVVWMKDLDASNSTPSNGTADRPSIANNALLRNTATFAHTTATGGTSQLKATADVSYREPALAITKSADRTDNISIGQTVTYTIAVSNPNRVKSYDNVVEDTVPLGLEVQPGSFKVGTSTSYAAATALADSDLSIAAGAVNGNGGKIVWNAPSRPLAALAEVPNTVYLFYQAEITPSASAGMSFKNDVAVTGYTLPSTLPDADARRGDREAEGSRTITAITAALTKGVKIAGASGAYSTAASAPIGETVEYQVTATLKPNINYYNVKLEDTFTGANIGTPVRTVVSGPNASPAGSVAGNWSRATSGLTDTWTIDDAGSHHIASSTQERTITIVYSVPLTTGITANQIGNTAKFTWTQTSDPESARSGVNGTATVSILNPLVGIQKQVDGQDAITRDAGDTFTYTVTARNTGTAAVNLTPAQNVTVQDVVPAGVRVATGQAGLVGATFSNAADLNAGRGGTITWTNVGPLYPAAQAGTGKPNAQTFTYEASFAASEALGTSALVNRASVTHFESFASGGRSCYDFPPTGAGSITDTASVTPLFPHVVPTKSVSVPVAGEEYGIATLDTPFGWTLSIANTGSGSAQAADVVDTLPENWSYVAGSAKVNGVALAEPSIDSTDTSLGTAQTLNWSAAQLEAAVGDLFPLAAGGSFTITYDAQPLEAAIDAPGTGLEIDVHPHTNTVAVHNVLDTQGKTHNADVDSYAGDDSTADAYIAEADLLLEKAAIGGVVDTGDAAENLYQLPAGTWVPGQAPVDGAYAQPQWHLTVTNYGPDASTGAFTVTDANTLPDGVSVSGDSWKARYFAKGAAAAGVELPVVVTGAGSAEDPFMLTVGNATTSLHADQSDRIVITADVNIAAGALARGDELANKAQVVGTTYEREANQGDDAAHPNTAEAAQPLTAVADLSIQKTVSTEAAEIGAGKAISWNLQVTNLGPATSISDVDGTQITVSDTIPDGISGVANPSNATWTATLNGAAWADGVTAEAGDVITWSYADTSIAPGQLAAAITLSGRVDPAFAGELANTATVTPGETEDPNEENNSSTVTVTPGTETVLSIDKTRVVQNGSGGWVAAGDQDPVPAPVPGETVSYRITVVNGGPAVARGVNVADMLPDYLSFVGFENVVGSWTSANAAGDQELSFVLADPAPLASPIGLAEGNTANSVSFILTTMLDSNFVLDADSFVSNTAVADADNAEPVSDDDISNIPSRDAQLSIEKTHAGDPIAGTEIPYTITVTNDGPSAARGPISITDALPAGLSYVAGSARINANGASLDVAASEPTVTERSGTGALLSWNVGTLADTFTLPVGGTIVVTLDVHLDAAISNGIKTNTAVADGPDGPAVTTTDEIEIERQASMSLVKQVADVDGNWVDSATAVAGTNVSYLLTVVNDGPSANPATLSDVLPEHLTLVSVVPVEGSGADGAGWDCAASVAGSQTANCSNPLLPVGESQILVTAALAPGAVADAPEQSAEFVNTATLSWTDRDTDDPEAPHTAEDTATVVAVAEADLAIVKRSWDQATETWTEQVQETAGEEVWFRLDVTNNGPSDAIPPISVTDTLPAGLTFDRLAGEDTLLFWSAEAGAVDPNTGQQTVVFTPTDETVGLGVGESLPPLRLVAAIAPEVPSEAVLENTATVTSGTTDPDLTNNVDTSSVVVDRVTDLAVTKSHDASTVRIGDALEFDINVANNGSSVSSGAVVTDTVPAGLRVTSEPGPVDAEAGAGAGAEADPDAPQPSEPVAGWIIESVTPADDGTTVVVARYDGEILVGASAPTLKIATIVEASAYPSVVNTAVVAPADEREVDPEPSNNSAEDAVAVPPMVTLVTEKTAVGTFQVGKTGAYTITVQNLGPTADPGPITVTDELPAGLSYRESPHLPAGVSVERHGEQIVWTIEDGLAVDELVTIELVVNVGQGAYPEVTNTVRVDSPAEKTPDSVLSDDATVQVKAADALAVTGGDFAAFALLAVLLLVLGGAAALLARRRRAGTV